jgi:hypothetical protein
LWVIESFTGRIPEARLHIKSFQPLFKLKEKHREGAKVVKRYLPPATPYEQALVDPSLDEAFKHTVREIYRSARIAGADAGCPK